MFFNRETKFYGRCLVSSSASLESMSVHSVTGKDEDESF